MPSIHFRYLALALALAIGVSACKKKPEIIQVDPAFANFVTAYTTGIISVKSPIDVMLNIPIDSAKWSALKTEDLWSFSPGLEGEMTLLNENTLRFTPSEALERGELYTVSLQLHKLIEVPESLRVFKFQVEGMLQNVSIEQQAYRSYSRTNYARQQKTVQFYTADVAQPEELQEAVSVTQNGNSLPVQWQHDALGKIHTLIIDSIARVEQRGTVELNVDVEELGIDGEDLNYMLDVPGLREFLVMDVKVNQQPEQVIEVFFSDPIDETQVLNGLVLFDDVVDMSFSIDENRLQIIPQERLTGTKQLVIEKAVRNTMKFSLANAYTHDLVFEDLKPAVRKVGEGSIVPGSGKIYYPFEAVNLKQVDVRILKIKERNIPQFLQVNNLAGTNELARVAKVEVHKTITLPVENDRDYKNWKTYFIDLNGLIKTEPGAIYKISVTFKKEYSMYACGEDTLDKNETQDFDYQYEEESVWMDDEGYGYYWDEDLLYGKQRYYDWDQRDNPCHKAYYNTERFISTSLIASDIGLIVKQGTNNQLLVVSSNLVSAEPMRSVAVDVLDYQKEVIASGVTNSEGFLVLNVPPKSRPWLVVAKSGNQRTYLKINEGLNLSVSNFDVSGVEVREGLKGMLYGERGVWRPGDTLFLTFVLEDRSQKLPFSFPIQFTLYNPNGQIVHKRTAQSKTSRFYRLTIPTRADFITGTYRAEVNVGGAAFYKSLLIETIKPNRLKIQLNLPQPSIKGWEQTRIPLQVNWLHGSPAKKLRTEVAMQLKPLKLDFPKFKNYVFSDLTRSFEFVEQVVLDEPLDENGSAQLILPEQKINVKERVTATFTTRTFEEGGEFSIDMVSVPLDVYPQYVGLSIPYASTYWKELTSGVKHTVKLAFLKPNGTPYAGAVKVALYKVDRNWWWDMSGGRANYVSESALELVKEESITINGVGSYALSFPKYDWGYYLLQIVDESGGHRASEVFFVTYDGNEQTAFLNQGDDAYQLEIKTDKLKYNTGEVMRVSIPSSAAGKALVTLENGKEVLDKFWINTQAGTTSFDVKVTERMTPNVYVHVSLLQPHVQTLNDLPIRMYGIQGVSVEHPQSHVYPVINAPQTIRPESTFNVQVSEKNKQSMTYTLAVVDQGLLDLTRFKTPDTWSHFFEKEALGVRTWDMYNEVIGAYTLQLQRVLSIGGDGSLDPTAGAKQNRFKPVVMYLGPFELKAGAVQNHTLKMPNYVGAVRVMVVAGQADKAYGSAQHNIQVKKPLMVLGTLPRALTPDNIVELPVTVFATEKSIKNVSVSVQLNDMALLDGPAKQTLTFSRPDEQVIRFRLKVKPRIGTLQCKITATSGNESASYVLNVPVNAANPPVQKVQDIELQVGETKSIAYTAFGITGTNAAKVEFSVLPNLKLEQRFRYLNQYPYGCVEQTVSAVFAQLYLPQLMEVSQPQKESLDKAVNVAITRLSGFQQTSGGLAYWPGRGAVDEWATTYAAHFLIEANRKGYNVPTTLFTPLIAYIQKQARNFRWNKQAFQFNEFAQTQGYRLQVLALNGTPELASMNNLREKLDLPNQVRWQLIHAYALAGQVNIAKSMVQNARIRIEPSAYSYYTYGSEIRDLSMIVEALMAVQERNKALPAVKIISDKLSASTWLSTQTTAYALRAVSLFYQGQTNGSSVQLSYSVNGSAGKSIQTTKHFATSELVFGAQNKGELKVTNKGKGALFVRVITSGVPLTGQEKPVANNLQVSVAFKQLNGATLNPLQIVQGTDFIAEYTVTNTSLTGSVYNIALSQYLPAGWEIVNTRLFGREQITKGSAYDYQDIRDDRVYTFFSLNKQETKTFRVFLNAAYCGSYYLPATLVEAMYDAGTQAVQPGKWVQVVAPQNQTAAK